MRQAMEHFVIYTNLHKDNNMAVTNRIREYLEGHGKHCVVRVKEMREKPDDFVLPEETECMIVLGGDGTMLQAAWDVKKRNIPLIGVNMGTLGYMTEIELSCLEESLDRLMEGHFSIENRMMLHGSVLCGDHKIEDWALNDIVISRSGSLQIIKFNIFIIWVIYKLIDI